MGVKKLFYGWVLISGWIAAIILLSFRDGIRQPAEPHQGGDSSRPSEFESIFEVWASDPSLAGALVGFCLLDDRGEVVFKSSLAETALCPASALKTVTTGAAFGLLGNHFQFETRLSSKASVSPEGVLAGDLVLVGSGDPTFGLNDLKNLAAEVVKAGLKEVRGDVRVDASVFARPPMSDHWNWGDIGNAYGAGAFGINVNHNRLAARFEPGVETGDAARFIGGGPVAKGTEWLSHVTTGQSGSGDGVVVYSQPFGRVITLEGTVPAGESSFVITGAIPDPPALALDRLREFLRAAGVVVTGEKLGSSRPDVVLASHRSAKLPAIIDHLHEVSDNLEAQCFFLTIGTRQDGDPAGVIRAYWESQGVSFVGLRHIDGSGLARANMIRPLDLARVNYAARNGPHGDRFRQTLSTYLDGTVRSKLGAMSGVKTEVGFITLADGREFTFALLANGLAPSVDFWRLRSEFLTEIRR